MRFATTILALFLASTFGAFAVDTNEVLRLLLSGFYSVDTNNMLVFHADKRPGAAIFIDECLTRGLTNSTTVTELRSWATNTILKYSSRPDFRTASLTSNDIPKSVQSIQASIPTCKYSYQAATNVYMFLGPDKTPPRVGFIRGASDDIEAISISWYSYGVLVGPESYTTTEKLWSEHNEDAPWYERKLTDGIYLWHGNK